MATKPSARHQCVWLCNKTHLGSVDLDCLRLLLFCNWRFQAQHTVIELGFHLFGIDLLGKMDRSKETAALEFTRVDLPLFFFVLVIRLVP